MVVTAGKSSSNPLPHKELVLFKKIVKCYDQKQYKTGLKFAKSILSVPQFAEHGETLCMKGLILNCMGKNVEAQESVKRGLMSDLRSHVCWHAYGLVQRSDKKNDEALKAYKRALMLDTENLQILRDLSLLQIQLRDYEGYQNSRYRLLKLRPSQKTFWIGYATAFHLLKDYDTALKILEEVINTNTPEGYDFEFSELLLYRNMIIRESGNPKLALEVLEQNAALICDKNAYLENRAELLFELGHAHRSENIWRQLLDRNPDCLSYYAKLEEILDANEPSEKLALYDELALKYKRAAAPKRLALYVAEGENLRERLRGWIVPLLRKGAPSLFSSLRPLYQFPEKIAIIESLINEFVKKMDNDGYKNVSLDETEGEVDPPSSALWLYVLAAQHFDRVGNTQLAMDYIERAIQHTPTLLENYMFKARIYKHAGDYEEAARLMVEAQKLDTADRYINSKCAKYLLRARQPEEADKMCAKFLRDGEKPENALNDMQCMWYEIESGRCYRAINNYGEALKRAHNVEQHFVTMVDDQYDFHSYCLRKITLCSYIRLLRLEDVIRRHNYYYQAAKMAIKIYLRMIDRPEDFVEKNGINLEGLTGNELKKMKKKIKKQEELNKKKEQEKESSNSKDDGNTTVPRLDAAELLKTENPLEEAAKFAHPLYSLGSSNVTAHALCAEVYRRKNKVLIVLKSLNEGAKIEPMNPLLHVQKIKFLQYYKTLELTGLVAEMATELIAKVFPDGLDPHKLNDQYKVANQHSFMHRLAVGESTLLLDGQSAESQVKGWILNSVDDESLTGRSLKNLIKLKDGIAYGKYGKWTEEEVAKVAKIAVNLFPLSRIFGGGVPHFEKSEEEN